MKRVNKGMDINHWILLAIAIAFEIAGTGLLKASDGFARWGLGMASMACYWVCFGFLAAAFKTIPVGVAYAIWSGFGIAVIAIFGWVVFRQSLSLAQSGFIVLNLTTPHGTETKAPSLQSSV